MKVGERRRDGLADGALLGLRRRDLAAWMAIICGRAQGLGLAAVGRRGGGWSRRARGHSRRVQWGAHGAVASLMMVIQRLTRRRVRWLAFCGVDEAERGVGARWAWVVGADGSTR